MDLSRRRQRAGTVPGGRAGERVAAEKEYAMEEQTAAAQPAAPDEPAAAQPAVPDEPTPTLQPDGTVFPPVTPDPPAPPGYVDPLAGLELGPEPEDEGA
jgi:hypothetical protein